MSECIKINESAKISELIETNDNTDTIALKTTPKYICKQKLNLSPDSLICPISGELFYDPVIAMDGFVYERLEIEKWLTKNNTSPINRKEIKKDLIECFFIKEIVTEFLNKNQEFRDDQYKPDMSFSANLVKINNFFQDNRYDKLVHYNNFDLEYMMNNKLDESLLKYCKDDHIIKYVIDNAINLEAVSNNGYRIIHKICKLSNQHILKHIISKGVLLECSIGEIGQWKPIYFATRYGSTDIIKLLINAGVSLENKERSECTPILITCKYNNVDSIRLVIDACTGISTDMLNIRDDINHNIINKIKINGNISLKDQKSLLFELSNNKDILRMIIDNFCNN